MLNKWQNLEQRVIFYNLLPSFCKPCTTVMKAINVKRLRSSAHPAGKAASHWTPSKTQQRGGCAFPTCHPLYCTVPPGYSYSLSALGLTDKCTNRWQAEGGAHQGGCSRSARPHREQTCVLGRPFHLLSDLKHSSQRTVTRPCTCSSRTGAQQDAHSTSRVVNSGEQGEHCSPQNR